MVKKGTPIPDAWDDDWESQADKTEESANGSSAEEPAKLSKAERLAQHAELNKQLWQSADTPETFHYLAARDTVPLKTEFKPALKVLSRKPAPNLVARPDPATGLSRLTIEDELDDDEQSKNNLPTAEEIRLKTQREREEKQRKYDEARARLFGTPDTGSRSSSPGTTTPPNVADQNRNNRGKGKNSRGVRHENRRPEGQPGSRELFDPDYSPKPGSVTIQKRAESTSSGRSTINADEQVIRSPRGPDGSGRGGFGFASRGGKSG